MRVLLLVLSTSPKYNAELFRELAHSPHSWYSYESNGSSGQHLSNLTLFQATIIKQIMPRLQLVPPPHSVLSVLGHCCIDSSGNCG
jgi:hypothetical protein